MQSIKNYWQQITLFVIAFITRLYLLSVFDVELSQDGFEAVRTLNILQTQGAGAVPHDLLDRFILHPFYMLLLGVLRILTPASFDFYLVARLLSTIIACIAVVILFEFVRRAYGGIAAWIAALFLAFAPTFLWESVAILSSATFLALYLAVLLALQSSRYRLAAFLAFLSTITRYEGVALVALVFIALFIRDYRTHKIIFADWIIAIACAFAFPITMLLTGLLASGNALEFLGANSMAAIWLRFMSPGDFVKRAQFFLTNYSALVPTPIVWLGFIGAIITLIWHRTQSTALLIGTSSLYLVFFETLVWLNYTTLETRFLMYPGLPLMVFAGVALSTPTEHAIRNTQYVVRGAWCVILAVIVLALFVLNYQQADAGLRYIYNSQASMRQMADELAQILPKNQRVNVLAYGGTSGALDMFARRYSIDLAFTEFRFAPDENPEQYIIDNKIQYIIYPVGNAFAKAKYPYLARFDEQTRNGVTFNPVSQFATKTDNQLYSIWLVKY